MNGYSSQDTLVPKDLLHREAELAAEFAENRWIFARKFGELRQRMPFGLARVAKTSAPLLIYSECHSDLPDFLQILPYD